MEITEQYVNQWRNAVNKPMKDAKEAVRKMLAEHRDEITRLRRDNE